MRSDVVKQAVYPRWPLSGRSLPYFGNDTMSVMNICITDQRLRHPVIKVLRAIGSVSSPALDSVEKSDSAYCCYFQPFVPAKEVKTLGLTHLQVRTTALLCFLHLSHIAAVIRVSAAYIDS
ncbi:hypothetical protein IG631_16573 [Alternaria alternata]|jgi:hypothetical protein|nr:hypothetical protein IG631_16573 [Alternaria alternata]